MWRVKVNVTLSTNGSKIGSFFIKSILGPHDIWKQRQNLITSWCVWDFKKNHGECHIFNQSEQSCLEMLTFLTNENQILPPWLLCGFLRPPGDFFTFNQPNIKYLYVIWCFLHIGPCRFHNIPPCSVGTRPLGKYLKIENTLKIISTLMMGHLHRSRDGSRVFSRNVIGHLWSSTHGTHISSCC